MGDYADDLKHDYDQEFEDSESIIFVPLEMEYEVSIIHRTTLVCTWVGKVTASSKKDAQREFRKKYAHIRSQYSHDYGLVIIKL